MPDDGRVAVVVNDDERPLLAPVIGPLAAMIIDRELGDWLRKRAAELRKVNQPDSARQLSAAAAQLREAARQFLELTSAGGSGEVPQLDDGAGLGLPPRTATSSSWWSTAVVAEELGVGSRQVRNLAQPGGPLTATTVGGRILIDPVSVIEEKQRRERQHQGEVA